MSDFQRVHMALFDELERQGAINVDVGRLTEAVLSARGAAAVEPAPLRLQPPDPRCANGACE